MQEQLEMYESLYFEGFPVGFATEKIINKQDNKDWDIIIVYKTEFVTDTEFATLQRYLDEGGTILIDNNGSLVKNEYGQLRNQSLQAGNGKILIMSDLASPAEIRNKALELLPTPAPLMLTEENGSPYKGCTWRLVENPQGGYLVNILNLGKNTAMLQFNTQEGKTVNCKDLLTGQMLDSEFELKPKGVLLLEVKQIN